MGLGGARRRPALFIRACRRLIWARSRSGTAGLVDDTTLISDSTLRFRSQDELTRTLIAHGYRLKDVRDAPDRPGRELVFIVERAT